MSIPKSIKMLADGMSERPIGIPFPFSVGDHIISDPDDWFAFLRIYDSLLTALKMADAELSFIDADGRMATDGRMAVDKDVLELVKVAIDRERV